MFNIRNIPNPEEKTCSLYSSSSGVHSKYYTGVNTACCTFCVFVSLTLSGALTQMIHKEGFLLFKFGGVISSR